MVEVLSRQDKPCSRIKTAHPVEWLVSEEFQSYPEAVAFMEQRAAEIRAGASPELVWLLEHEPLYTAGTSANAADLLSPDKFPVFKASRGGQYTYHGPGQRVAYVMLDLDRRGRDIRAYVHALEDWIIDTLSTFDLVGETRADRVGVWIDRSETSAERREDKIAAIGVRVRKWVSFHGISLNVNPDLSHFGGITPCGIDEKGLGVTSLTDLGRHVTMPTVDGALQHSFENIFGPTIDSFQPR